MSTVLTKPVLLDETGQAIVGKLQDIQQAIGGTGEFIPINIRVTTPPTKTNYLAGETLDLSGMVVTLVANNGGMYDVTGDCVFSPADGATVTSSTTEVNISYTWYKDSTVFTAEQPLVISEPLPVSLAVSTPPTKTKYAINEALDLAGIVVTVTYSDGNTADVSASCTFNPANGTILDDINIDEVLISYVERDITVSTSQVISVDLPIYGAEWDGTATSAWTRTDLAADFVDPVPQMSDGDGGWTQGSSPFDNILPWSGMVRENLQDIGPLVKIPKFYFKWTRDGSKMKLQISPMQLDGFFTSPAHADRGDGVGERDYVYIGAYHCDFTYHCTSGAIPQGNKKKAECRTGIHTLGTDLWMMDYAMYMTVAMLYLVEYADWNSQDKIGRGGSDSGNIENLGATDLMTYHTGTTKTDKETPGHTKYREIEDLWGNVCDWVDGIYFANTDIYIIKNPANFADTSNGTKVGERLSGASSGSGHQNSGVVKSWTEPTATGYEYAIYPYELTTDNDYLTYSCDRCMTIITGQSSKYNNALQVSVPANFTNRVGGLFFLLGNVGATDSNSSSGCRLMRLPNGT